MSVHVITFPFIPTRFEILNQWENYKMMMMYNNLTDSLHLNCFGMRLSVTKGQCLTFLAINVDHVLTQR